jgi:YbbR domain-containing protein
MLKRFTHNWGLKVTALVLSLALWSHVRGEVNPWETATFKVKLSVETPRGFVLQNAEALPASVGVTVRGPRLTLRALKGGTPPNPLSGSEEPTPLSSRQLRASLDFSGPRQGLQKVPVKAETSLADVEVIGAKPNEVGVVLDIGSHRMMQVEPQFILPPQWQATSVVPSIPAVKVSGASQVLERIDVVTAQIEKSVSAPGALEMEVPLQALDEKGRAVEDVRFEPPTVRVRAQIRERQDEKTVPVKVRVEGEAARGYELQAASVEPGRATIRGPRRALAAIESLPVRVDAGGARELISQRVRLRAPAGVEVVAPRRVRVRVGVRRIETPATNSANTSSQPSTPTTNEPAAPESSGNPSTLPAPAQDATKQ